MSTIKTKLSINPLNSKLLFNTPQKSPAVKRQALEFYLEGLGFQSIGRVLKCCHVAVYDWIKSFGEEVAELLAIKLTMLELLVADKSAIGIKIITQK